MPFHSWSGHSLSVTSEGSLGESGDTSGEPSAWLVASGARPGTPRNSRKIPVFGRPEIVKNLTFWLSDPTFEPGIGTGMAGNPPYLILRSGG